MTTPHLSAPDGAYAPIVLMPGDPLRARYIATTFLDTDEPLTAVRAMEGYTGTWNGVPVSVQGSGMGIPSFLIYATELVRFYGVRSIVRVGSCGALQDDVELGDIVVATAAGTDSGTNRARFNGWDLPAVASWSLLRRFGDVAHRADGTVHFGPVFTSDYFYGPDDDMSGFELLEKRGMLAVEMEAAGLYGVARQEGIEALAVMTVSDHVKRHEQMPAEERQTGFDAMMRLTLDAITAA